MLPKTRVYCRHALELHMINYMGYENPFSVPGCNIGNMVSNQVRNCFPYIIIFDFVFLIKYVYIVYNVITCCVITGMEVLKYIFETLLNSITYSLFYGS